MRGAAAVGGEVQQRVYRVKCTLPIELGEPRAASDFLTEPGMELVIPAPVPRGGARGG